MLDKLREQYREQWAQQRARLEPKLAPAMAWYRQREEREQRALQILGAAFLVMLVYLMLWKPVIDGYQSARDRYQHHQGLLNWIESNAAAIRRQQNTVPTTGRVAGGDWINVINSSASNEGVSLRGFTPEGDDAVRVSLEQQSFAAAMGWLQTLESEHGIRAANVEVTAGQQSGTVNIRATLRRAG